MLTGNEVQGARVLVANKVGNVEGGDRLKYVKLKTRRLES